MTARKLRYWSYDGEQVDTHATQKEAKAACQAAIDWLRDDGDGWDESVENIMWGEIIEETACSRFAEHLDTCVKRIGQWECADGCPVHHSTFDYFADYALARVKRKADRQAGGGGGR